MLPLVTLDLPPIDGTLRSQPEDFAVEEIARYQPCGQGTHLYLWIEKRGLTTFEVVRRLANALKRPADDFGFAGLKDRVAVTRQWISVEHASPEELATAASDALRILATSRHGNKLRAGHLAGNRFTLRVRGAGAGAAPRAQALLDRLVERGVPNRYGDQRFGVGGQSPRLGRALLRGDLPGFVALLRESVDDLVMRQAVAAAERAGRPEAALRSLPKRLVNLLIAAVQSEVFNAVLLARLPTYDRLQDGDLAYLHRNGACFRVEDAAAEQPRAAAFEVSPSGPILGARTLMGGGEPRALEERVFATHGLAAADFDRIPGLRQKGARRSLRVPLQDVSVAGAGEDLVLRFALPAGSYATVVLEQLFQRRLTMPTASADAAVAADASGGSETGDGSP